MKKLVLALLIIASLATATVSATTIYSTQKRHADWKANRQIITITVRSGDSIDEYWVKYAPEWMDRRDYRYEIKQLNNMDSCMIYAGQTLRLYAEGGDNQ